MPNRRLKLWKPWEIFTCRPSIIRSLVEPPASTMCSDAGNEQLSDDGFDWTALLDDLEDRVQTSYPSAPAQTPNTGFSGDHTHFDWLDLWDDIQPLKTQSAPSTILPPTPESLPKPAQFPSTPKTSFSPLSPSSPPPLDASLYSPSSSVIQTPISNTDRKPYIPSLDLKNIVKQAPVQDNNPFLVSSPCLEKPSIPTPPQRPVLEVPYDWSFDTPTPVRFHPTTIQEPPPQPVFEPVGQPRGPSTEQCILWLTHLSTSGGLTTSLKRLSLPHCPYPKLRGVTKTSHPQLFSLGSAGKDDLSYKHVQLTRLVSDLREITRAVPDITLALENTVHPSQHSLTTLSSLCTILTHFPPSQLKLCLDLSHLHVKAIDMPTLDYYRTGERKGKYGAITAGQDREHARYRVDGVSVQTLGRV
ncbi:hypothetical protein I307_00079 [Cryptococcus deuterogattii 99/473]|uniref:Xylose isomerase-like TIM barrel domain-containing protein n=1 Tax=Cryptococcus deuterogattii Ram5 TaxID=1296110 RepID=A0A0D0U6P6_9TREE|nr:hypothetical protein I313_00724 [Cryptococcus deuterogattii Ram5]KIR75210.1 hypothetical protein I310_01488 [Cryptococcus deuterogattii CA1014]KIY60280.1 hypothetical protein I307_00079 [Cryptococcus deuterogattii 99/473]